MDPGLPGQASPEPRKPDPSGPTEIDLLYSIQIQEPNQDDEDLSSSSSTTDSSDGDDFFQLDPLGLGQPIPASPIQPAKFNFDPNPSRSQTEDPGQTHSIPGTPPLHPFRNDVPDQNRIPSSVFARTKSTTPMEWSVASNESLFSIQMGNSSFSRDNVFLTGRSGEFPTGPLDSFQTPAISPISSPIPPTFPPISPLPPQIRPVLELPPLLVEEPPAMPVSSNRVGCEAGDGLEEPEVADATNAEAMKDVSSGAVKGSSIGKEKPGQEAGNFSKSISRRSDGSTASFRSFAFPILTGDGGRSGSMKVELEHQRMQSHAAAAEQQTPKISDNVIHKSEAPEVTSSNPPASTPPAEEEKGWFSSCFSCCSFCK